MGKFICVILVLLSVAAQATVPNSQYISAARTRKYIGGKDESDLKVQSMLYQAPNKKKKPVRTEPSEGF